MSDEEKWKEYTFWYITEDDGKFLAGFFMGYEEEEKENRKNGLYCTNPKCEKRMRYIGRRRIERLMNGVKTLYVYPTYDGSECRKSDGQNICEKCIAMKRQTFDGEKEKAYNLRILRWRLRDELESKISISCLDIIQQFVPNSLLKQSRTDLKKEKNFKSRVAIIKTRQLAQTIFKMFNINPGIYEAFLEPFLEKKQVGPVRIKQNDDLD